MSSFCPDQGRTRVFGEAYSLYAAAGNPRRTQVRAKGVIYGWKLINCCMIPNNRNEKKIQDNTENGALSRMLCIRLQAQHLKH